MEFTLIDMEFENKKVRAEHRATVLHKKRVAYSKSLQAKPKAKRTSFPVTERSVAFGAAVPHGAARTMTRTCLAKGMVDASADLPTISMGRSGRWVPVLRKPSVSSLMTCAGRAVNNVDADDATFVQQGEIHAPSKSCVAVELALDLGDAPTTEGSDCSASMTDESSIDTSDTEQWPALVSCKTGGRVEEEELNAVQKCVRFCSEVPDSHSSVAARERSGYDEMRVSRGSRCFLAAERAARKEARRVAWQQQRGAAGKHSGSARVVKKKQKQVALVDALKHKTEETLCEAESIYERAEVEATASMAHLLAASSVKALAEAEELAACKVMEAEQRVQAVKQERLREIARKEAEMKARLHSELKFRAQMVAMSKLDHADQIAKEASSLQERAEQEARSIKEKAVLDAVMLRTSAKDASSEATAAIATLSNNDVQKPVRMEELPQKNGAAAIKQAKQLEKQRAQEMKRQVERKATISRQRQRELEDACIKAAKEKAEAADEAALIRAEACAMSNKVKEEARRKAAEEVSRKAELVKAQEEADTLTQQRLHEAAQAEATMRARVESELEAKRVATAQELEHFKATIEADVQAKAALAEQLCRDASDRRERAEQEARSMKTNAVFEAVSLRKSALETCTKKEDEVDAQLQAALKAKNDAEVSAQKELAASLKRVKELEQQRAKRLRKEAETEKTSIQKKQRELEFIRTQAAEEKAQAAAEAARIRADAHAMRNKIKEEARIEALAEAAAIRAAAEAESLELRAQVQHSAHTICSSSREVAADAGAISDQHATGGVDDDVVSMEQSRMDDAEERDHVDVEWELLPCSPEDASEADNDDVSIEVDGDVWSLVA